VQLLEGGPIGWLRFLQRADQHIDLRTERRPVEFARLDLIREREEEAPSSRSGVGMTRVGIGRKLIDVCPLADRERNVGKRLAHELHGAVSGRSDGRPRLWLGRGGLDGCVMTRAAHAEGRGGERERQGNCNVRHRSQHGKASDTVCADPTPQRVRLFPRQSSRVRPIAHRTDFTYQTARVTREAESAMAVERTLCILKPDAVEKRRIGAVLQLVQEGGFEILAMKMTHLTRPVAEGFYEVHRARPFFRELVQFMTRAPVVVAVLQRENAVVAWRDLMGATDPAKAAAGTVRKLFGSNVGENATHGSDSLDNAKREIAYFFPGCEVAPSA
jgi:nucleoside-diphosphate kinase